jgi:hypothetical protein
MILTLLYWAKTNILNISIEVLMEANKEVDLDVSAEEAKHKHMYMFMFMCRHKGAERNRSIVNSITENVAMFRNLGMVARK